MKLATRISGPFLIAAAISSPTFAANIDNGDELHMDSCTGCHDSQAYTRADRKVKDLDGLGRQVRFCKDNLGVPWFDDEVDDGIAYLNHEFYKF